MNQNIEKAYVSDYDKFLYEFDMSHPVTASQLTEINKHARIALKRDEPVREEVINDIEEV